MLLISEVTTYLSAKVLFHASLLYVLDYYLGSYYNFCLGAIECNYISRAVNIFLLLVMTYLHWISQMKFLT